MKKLKGRKMMEKGEKSMDIIRKVAQRAKEVLLRPGKTFEVIKDEAATSRDLIFGYLVILAIIPAVASIIGMSAVGTFRLPLVNSLSMAVVQYVLTLIGIYILGLIINALASSFSGVKNEIQALKVAVYCATPSLVAGILYIAPALSVLAIIAGLYGLYLLYLAIPIMMGCPKEKALGYTVVVIIVDIVVSIVISSLVSLVPGVGLGFRFFG
ncbi:YIP1 family protein [Candidatus Aerophobetes bacterium]|uniref:YIP1 family protein n=1 Tax=Aerophobetes bacterium TaxID=2030807 RepID=A0A523S3S2_UNCAE|nr:MAG: YIP1 family protein [Candidatus Aerophobetes bacterium]